MFTVDGLVWDIPCTIQRTAEIKASDISGLLLDRIYFNDVLGTYMSYTIKLAVPKTMADKYTAIYETLTAPVDGHSFVLPYNNTTIELTARVTNVSDVYVRLPDGKLTWRGISFTVIANHPSKYMTLGEVLTNGLAPFPPISSPNVGDTYTYTADGWEKVEG